MNPMETSAKEYLEIIEKHRTDKEEVQKLAFYSEIKGVEKIAPIDEKLLEFLLYQTDVLIRMTISVKNSEMN